MVGKMAVSGRRSCSSRTRTSRNGQVTKKGWHTTGATAMGGGSARCWRTGTLPDTGLRFSFRQHYSPEECVEDEFLESNTTVERTGSKWHDRRRDQQVCVGVEGVRAHPGDDSEGGGRVVQRRARRDTDSRCAARATAARAHEG